MKNIEQQISAIAKQIESFFLHYTSEDMGVEFDAEVGGYLVIATVGIESRNCVGTINEYGDKEMLSEETRTYFIEVVDEDGKNHSDIAEKITKLIN